MGTPIADGSEHGQEKRHLDGKSSNLKTWRLEDCDRLFETMKPKLKEFVEQFPGQKVDGLTYNVMRSWLPDEGLRCSSKKGPDAVLKRLWAMAEAQLRDWGEEVDKDY